MPETCSRCGEFIAPPRQDHLARRRALAIHAALAERDADAALAFEQQPCRHASVSIAQVLAGLFACARKVRAVEPRKRPLRVICE